MDTARRNTKARRELSIFDAPSYRVGEVAHLLKVPNSTVLSWCFGQAYRNRQGAPKTFQPVIEPAEPVRRLLSFSNVRTDVIFNRFGAGDSPTEMAGDYGVGEDEMFEALRFEQRLAT